MFNKRMMAGVRSFLGLFMFIYVMKSCANAQGTMDDLMRLKNTLFQNYTKDFRPVYYLSFPLHVTLDMFLISVLDVDEVTGTITLNCGLTLTWTDYRLAWNSSDFNGITSFVFNSSNVWKPRVYVTTSADDLSDFSYDAFDVRVFTNGVVTSSPSRHLRASCSFDMTKFPMDSQTCFMQLAPWMYTVYEMIFIISRPEINLLYYTPNGEWDIKWTSVTNNTDFGHLYSIIDFTIHLTRRSAYFIVSMTSPVLLLCFLNPFVFLLPASSGERISYTITMFLSLAVYMTLIGENMPNISDPMAGISYLLLVAMIYSSILILLTIYTLRCDALTDVNKFPDWLLWLACRLCRSKSTNRNNNVGINAKMHVKEFDKEAAVMKRLEDQTLEKKMSKEDVMGFIDKSLFYITLFMNILTWFVFAIYYWI